MKVTATAFYFIGGHILRIILKYFRLQKRKLIVFSCLNHVPNEAADLKCWYLVVHNHLCHINFELFIQRELHLDKLLDKDIFHFL